MTKLLKQTVSVMPPQQVVEWMALTFVKTKKQDFGTENNLKSC